MSLIAQRSEWISLERRRATRKLVSETILLQLTGHVVQSCAVHDLSVYGGGLWLPGRSLLPTEFRLSFDGFRTMFGCRLIWRDGDRAGVEFQAEGETRQREPAEPWS
jgi:hypothetical protein